MSQELHISMASSSNPFRGLLNGSIPSHIKRMMKHRRRGGARVASERIARMMKNRDAYGNAVEFEIEASKVHWSQLGNSTASFTHQEEGNLVTNEETFASLKEEWGGFFRDYGDELVIGEKFAEGGQAEIFRADWTHSDGKVEKCVVKIFKEGYALHDLRKQWPQGMLEKASDGGYYSSNSCQIYGGLLLKNGKFGFLMESHECDLRKLIDDLMIRNNNKHSPFWVEDFGTVSGATEGHALVSIAWGMWALHEHNIIHRDLKASNVLYRNHIRSDSITGLISFDPWEGSYVVSDFECSVGVVGTGYWRAPEILQAVKIGDIKSHLFTKGADVYSFSMTCYEVLTGHIPFEDLGPEDYDVVINGERPKLPKRVAPKLKALLEKCWHPNPLERPSFKYILEELQRIYPKKIDRDALSLILHTM